MSLIKIKSESLNLTDNYAFTGTVTGAGESNKPYFHAYLGSNQTLSNNTDTKAIINTEVVDSDNAFDHSSNYRFTPQTAGKYYVYGASRLNASTGRIYAARTKITKNNSNVVSSQVNYHDSSAYTVVPTASAIVDMNGSSDYLELFVFMEWHGSQTLTLNNHLNGTYFGAYLLSTT